MVELATEEIYEAEFRFYAWGAELSSHNQNVGTLRFDDVTVRGGFFTDTATEDEIEVPVAFELSRAYPNPFNPSTTIELMVSQAQEIVVELIDVLGRRVQAVDQRHYSAGRHDLRIEAEGLSSGVYFVRATGTNHVGVTKVLLAN